MIAVLDRVREFYFGKKNKLVMELREGKENSFSCFRFGSCWWLCRFACSDGYCQNTGKNKAKMAPPPRKICTIVGRLGGSGERELGSRCLWSEPQSLQSVCFLALKYFFFLPPCFTESWGGSFLLLFWNVSLPTSGTENTAVTDMSPKTFASKGNASVSCLKTEDPTLEY